MPARSVTTEIRDKAERAIADAAAVLSERFGIAYQPVRAEGKDRDYLAAMELSGIAGFLTSLAAADSPYQAELADTKAELVGDRLSDDAILAAYSFYDMDQRTHGPDDFDAFCEAITRALSGERVNPGEPAPEPNAEETREMTRAELNEAADQLGIEGAAKLPNKQAVIDAINARSVELLATADPNVVPEPDESVDWDAMPDVPRP